MINFLRPGISFKKRAKVNNIAITHIPIIGCITNNKKLKKIDSFN